MPAHLADPGMTDCTEHRRIDEARRGTSSKRGYGSSHQALRRAWAPRVAAGVVPCARCGVLIGVGVPWDLGHTDDRAGYRGPEHVDCNRTAPKRSRA